MKEPPKISQKLERLRKNENSFEPRVIKVEQPGASLKKLPKTLRDICWTHRYMKI